MFEIGLLVALFVGATLVVGTLRARANDDADFDEELVDLPCPWCEAQTRETDRACPSCHQAFGVRVSYYEIRNT